GVAELFSERRVCGRTGVRRCAFARPPLRRGAGAATPGRGNRGRRMTGMNDRSGRGPSGTSKADGLGTNSEIGRKLKQYYDELVTDQVPDRFMDLLKQLETKEDATKPAKD